MSSGAGRICVILLRPGTACSDPATCVINATTVSMPIYDWKAIAVSGLKKLGAFCSRVKEASVLLFPAGCEAVLGLCARTTST